MTTDRQLSKFLAYVLRHSPESIGVELEPGGWVRVSALLDKGSDQYPELSEKRLDKIVQTDPKNRYSFDDEGTRIRANYGHSVDVDLQLSPKSPPSTLVHGTATDFVDSIRRDGLVPMGRQGVHLYKDTSEGRRIARQVGNRHGRPVILEVHTPSVDATEFYESESGVWLTERVPPKAIEFPETDN